MKKKKNNKSKQEEQEAVAVIGLGYVGLPLALAFAQKRKTIGYDLNEEKITAYKKSIDPSGELSKQNFKNALHINFTSDSKKISSAKYIVVAVPTPIDGAKKPNLTPLISASEVVGKNLKKGAIVIFESTVYPGVTEEVCGPIIEKHSGLIAGKDFKLGYSPERINPGDKQHTLENIVKIVSAQDSETLKKVASLYKEVVHVGVYEAQSIKVAEAAKIIENTQRDLNIALINELSIIFHKLGIDTKDVLSAALTKWNFLNFQPGLVGGHCIGVDPYYLTYKAESLGYHPEVILSGRRINDNMGKYIAEQTIKEMISCHKSIKDSVILILGLTFKENCADLRNSKVVDIIEELKSFQTQPVVWDPMASKEEAKREYGIQLVDFKKLKKINAIIAAVPHSDILKIDFESLSDKTQKPTPFIDVKSAFNKEELHKLGYKVWRL